MDTTIPNNQVNNCSVIDVTTETFEDVVLNHSDPTLLVFYAEWCQMCAVLRPSLEAAAKEFEPLRVAKLDVDNDEEIADLFGIQYLPSLRLIVNGKLAGEWQGVVPEDLLLGGIRTALEVAYNCPCCKHEKADR